MSADAGDFDARRVGWWARRGAARRIRQSSAIMPADRDLRLQQVGTAQTRGELNALTRGLDHVVPAVTTYAPPPRPTPQTPAYTPPTPQTPAYTAPPAPQQTSAYAQPPSASTPPAAGHRPGQPVAPKKSIVRPVAIGVIIVLVMCGGGVTSCVSAVVNSVQDISSETSSPSSPPDLETEEGWADMVDAFEAEADLADTVGVLVRRRSATLSVDGGGTRSERFYYDGDVTPTSDVSRLATELPFDLTEVDPTVVIDAVAQARRSSGESESTEAWVQVWATSSGSRVLVAFPSAADSYTLVVDGDGTVVSETP